MNNRFSIIKKYIMNPDSDVDGIYVKRRIPLGEDKGFVRNISTEIIDFSNLSDRDKDIVSAGMPNWDHERMIFGEPFYGQQRIIILGGGHVAIPLTALAKMIGMYVIVVDDRADFADEGRFPKADEVICDSFEKAIRRLNPGKSDFVVIITRGHINDTECIKALMNYDEPVYTGMMGSKKRVASVISHLRENGYDGSRLDRIHTPIGLSIGAKTIEEIDISIISEIIKVRRSATVTDTPIDRGDHDILVISRLAEIDLPCAIATIISDEGSTPRSAGAVMAVFCDGSIIGSVGGGCVESIVIHRAKSLINTGKYEIVNINMDGETAASEGMICGGRVTVLIEDFTVK